MAALPWRPLCLRIRIQIRNATGIVIRRIRRRRIPISRIASGPWTIRGRGQGDKFEKKLPGNEKDQDPRFRSPRDE